MPLVELGGGLAALERLPDDLLEPKLRLGSGERLFDGTAAELHAAVSDSQTRDFERAFVSFLRERGH